MAAEELLLRIRYDASTMPFKDFQSSTNGLVSLLREYAKVDADAEGIDIELHSFSAGSFIVDFVAMLSGMVTVYQGREALGDLLRFIGRLTDLAINGERLPAPSRKITRAAMELAAPVSSGVASEMEMIVSGSNSRLLIDRMVADALRDLDERTREHRTIVPEASLKGIVATVRQRNDIEGRVFEESTGWFLHSDDGSRTKLDLSRSNALRVTNGRRYNISGELVDRPGDGTLFVAERVVRRKIDGTRRRRPFAEPAFQRGAPAPDLGA